MSVFVDVGAHDGQTIAEALRYDFTRLYALEPMPAQFAHLASRFGDPRLRLLCAGLAERGGRRPMYGSNDALEASLYPDNENVDADIVTECTFIEASEFFADNIGEDEETFVKVNCEGAEIEILANLIASGEIGKATSLLVDFDAHHVSGMEDAEEEIRERLAEIGFDRLVTSADVVPRGLERRTEGTYRYSRADEIMCWLKSHGVAEQ